MTSIFWLSLRFLALYAVLLAAFAFPPLHQIAGAIVGAGAAEILAWCVGAPVNWALSPGGIDFSVLAGEPRYTITMPILEHVRNLPLFFAIVLAAAKVRRRGLLLVLGCGAFALIVLDSLIVAAETWEYVADTVPFNRAYQVLALFRVYHATGAAGMFAAPVFIGALIALTFLGSERGTESVANRNAPCPCGSGLKFKRCCGAPQ